MHYYFHTREDIHECLVTEAYSIVADCVGKAKREDTLLKQLSTFVAATHASGFADRSMVEDAIAARRDSGRHRSGGSGEDDAGDVCGNRLHVGFIAIQTTCR
jgi:hypothetical protein